jgi:hypothetical protein
LEVRIACWDWFRILLESPGGDVAAVDRED